MTSLIDNISKFLSSTEWHIGEDRSMPSMIVKLSNGDSNLGGHAFSLNDAVQGKWKLKPHPKIKNDGELIIEWSKSSIE